MIAAQHLNKGIDENPYPSEFLDGKWPGEPGHPYYEWEAGFRATRILLHLQQSRNLSLGRGMLFMATCSFNHAIDSLIALGRLQGEACCMAILAICLEIQGTNYDVHNPEQVLAIYGAMKQRMSDRQPQCHNPDLRELNEEAWRAAGILRAIFERQDRATITMNTAAFRGFLAQSVEMSNAEMKAIVGQ